MKVTIVGASLCGLPMAMLLARRGHTVDVYESRPDPRMGEVQGGRSINLTFAERGLATLRVLGLESQVLERLCTPLSGRSIHDVDGGTRHSPYGLRSNEYLYAVSRTQLNKYLIDVAESEPNIRLHFDQRCVDLDSGAGSVTVADQRTGEERLVTADLVIGADGAHSSVRRLMQRGLPVDFSQHYIPWRYKELVISSDALKSDVFDGNALHIWPRGQHMMFAIPNLDWSFNAVCVLPERGENSFESLRTPAAVAEFFQRNFPDAVPFMPNLVSDFLNRPACGFPTIKTSSWHFEDKVVLVGDAAHAVIPFYGQGMNAGLEDCLVLDECLAAHPDDRRTALATFEQRRKENVDALADLSIQNFAELRDTVRRPTLAARKRVMLTLYRLLGDRVMPPYSMVSHSTMPYRECVNRARRQQMIARLCGVDILVGLVALTGMGVKLLRAARRKLVRAAA